MKVIIILALVAVAVAYEDVSATYNFEAILNDKENMHKFFGCFLDRNPCSVDEQHIKDHHMEIISDGCRECDLRQRHYAHLITNAMKKAYPEEFEEYKKKYDPEGKYFKQFEKALEPY